MSLTTDLGETKERVDSAHKSLKNLEIKMQSMENDSRALVISNDKQVPTGAKNTITQTHEKKGTSTDRYLQNIEDYPVGKCKNCKRNPCLHEMPVTLENFVHNAYVRGSAGAYDAPSPTHGYIIIDNRDNTYKLCWSYDHNKGQHFTQIFTENIKSLRFACHT